MVIPTVISTFAGCGGSSLGYKWAGFKELLAIDFDDNAVETFKLNFDAPIWNKDIKDCKGQDILDFCKIRPGELDILDGSPPCQGFSTAGKRNLNDSRNDLFLEFVRLITELQPKVFIMENVSGMIKGGYKGKFNEILRTLKSTGYNVKVKLLNAMWYEVPQSRERLFFIGVRKDLGLEPVYPEPMDKIITVKEAISNVIPTEFMKQTEFSKELAKTMKAGTNGYIKNGKKTGFNYVRISADKPCPTLLKSIKYCGLGMYHYEQERELSVEELKVLCTFPVDYQFTGLTADKINRMGNAVMPKQMYHIAKTIKEKILDKYYESQTTEANPQV